MNDVAPATERKPRYLWPWFLLAALLLGVAIAILSVRSEVDRIKTQRSLEAPGQGPN